MRGFTPATTAIDEKLSELFPDANKQKTNRQRILEAAALIAFHQQGSARSVHPHQ